MPVPPLSLPLILASASPRRAALLDQLGLTYRVVSSEMDEPPPQPGDDLVAWAMRAAEDKARAAARVLPAQRALLLGADTVVVLPLAAGADAPCLHGCPVEVMGKPGTPERATAMLRQLSGRSHRVLSAFALLDPPDGAVIADAAETVVTFRELSAAEIAWYVATGEPLDKAGGYGIQGSGAVLVDRIDGDYTTVVGLPLARLWTCLAHWRREGDA